MDAKSEKTHNWLAEYLKSYDDLLYDAYKNQTSGEQFAAACRDLKRDMSALQLVMTAIFELMGTYKILKEEAERWGDTRACRQLAWEHALQALQKLEAEPLQAPLIN